MAIFDCPRVMMVSDKANGCLTLKFGTMTLNVYGSDPYTEAPVIVEYETDRALIKAQNDEWLASLTADAEKAEKQDGS